VQFGFNLKVCSRQRNDILNLVSSQCIKSVRTTTEVSEDWILLGVASQAANVLNHAPEDWYKEKLAAEGRREPHIKTGGLAAD